ncbi:MAG: gamma-glutamyl kinase [Paracoccaceae bacterium]
MLVSFNRRLVILAMPKCASTALEKALEGRMDLVLRGHPGIKHMRLRGYQRFIEPYLASLTDKPFEVISAFREPEDWLHSWWRYRRRDGMRQQENSTKGMKFNQFAELYADGGQKPADVGRQGQFISDKNGDVGVDRLFRYDRMEGMVRYVADRMDCAISLERHNVSPPAPWLGSKLTGQQRAAFRAAFARDYDIYENIAV